MSQMAPLFMERPTYNHYTDFSSQRVARTKGAPPTGTRLVYKLIERNQRKKIKAKAIHQMELIIYFKYKDNFEGRGGGGGGI